MGMAEHVRYQVIKAISGVTGMDGDDLIEHFRNGPLEVDKRDYFEIAQRIEAFFDCALDFNYEGPYRIDADQIVNRIMEMHRGLAGLEGDSWSMNIPSSC